jgi:hypothetical protein
VGAMTPHVVAREGWRRWYPAILYTTSGAATSVAVGASVAAAASALLPASVSTDETMAATLVLGAACLVHALGWRCLPIGGLKRQTKDLWARKYGAFKAAAFWGADLGSTVSTRFTFTGATMVLVLAVALRDVRLGMALLLAYWLGRALPVWVSPFVVRRPDDTQSLLVSIHREQRQFRLLHVYGLALIALVAISILATGKGG